MESSLVIFFAKFILFIGLLDALTVQQCSDLGNSCWQPMGRDYENPTPRGVCNVITGVSVCLHKLTGCAAQVRRHLVHDIGKASMERMGSDYVCNLDVVTPIPEDSCGQDRYICTAAYSKSLLELQTTGRGNSISDICSVMETYADCWLAAPMCSFGGRPELGPIIAEEIARTRADCKIPKLETCKTAEEQCGSIEVSLSDTDDDYCKNMNLKLSCYAITKCISDVQLEILKTNAKNQSVRDGKTCAVVPIDPETLMSSRCRDASRHCVEDFVSSVFTHHTDAIELCNDLEIFLTCYRKVAVCRWSERELDLISVREQRRMKVFCPSLLRQDGGNGQAAISFAGLAMLPLCLCFTFVATILSTV